MRPWGHRAAFAASLALIALQVTPAPVSAAPVITVRARTAIEMEPIHRDYGGITVKGRVVDRLTRDPIPYMVVTVTVDEERRDTQSDADGLFETSFPLAEGTHDLHVEFDGDRHFTASSVEIPAFDVAKNPLTLAIYTDKTARYGESALEVIVKAGSETSGVSLRAEVYAGPADSDEIARVGTVQTDYHGRGIFRLTPQMMGEPGRKRVEARFPGDDTFDTATATSTFSLVTGSTTAFELRSDEVSFESRLRGNGKVTDDRGGGIADGPVVLTVESRRVAQTLTNDDGTFELDVAASELGPGKHNVQAVFEPTRAWRLDSRSVPIAAVVAEPRPIPVSYTLAAFAATALALMAFVGLRTQPWRKWLARLRPASKDEPAEREEREDRSTPIRTGLSPARPSLVSTLRRASDAGFTGTVRNAVNGRPIPGASITLSHPEHGLRVTDSETEAGKRAGHFSFEDLGAGHWSASAKADGFVAEEFEVSIPHHGELRGVRIDLLPVRERIFSMYSEIARPLLPDPRLWCIWTPRQIFDHVRALRLQDGAGDERPAPRLAALTDFVEETYFSQRIPHESALEEAREAIDRARAEAAVFGPTLIDS